MTLKERAAMRAANTRRATPPNELRDTMRKLRGVLSRMNTCVDSLATCDGLRGYAGPAKLIADLTSAMVEHIERDLYDAEHTRVVLEKGTTPSWLQKTIQ